MLSPELLPQDWRAHLSFLWEASETVNLDRFLTQQQSSQEPIFPSTEQIFHAFHATPLDELKVIILGQDPYHGVGQAQGLAFSVPNGMRMPPSLRNIFKELDNDLGHQNQNTDLTPWATQGVLLLNSVLTVKAQCPGSHANQGWESLTDQILSYINRTHEHLVFMLWGAQAQKKSVLIDAKRHLILTAPHPSPLSAYRGFFGSKPFSKCNDYLQQHEQKYINWQL